MAHANNQRGHRHCRRRRSGLAGGDRRRRGRPKLSIALLSKVYPMRSHTCAAEGGAAVVKQNDSLDYHFNDTVGAATG